MDRELTCHSRFAIFPRKLTCYCFPLNLNIKKDIRRNLYRMSNMDLNSQVKELNAILQAMTGDPGKSTQLLSQLQQATLQFLKGFDGLSGVGDVDSEVDAQDAKVGKFTKVRPEVELLVSLAMGLLLNFKGVGA